MAQTAEKFATSIMKLLAEVHMTLPMDGDLCGFLWGSVTVVFGSKPQLRQNSRPIPVRYQKEVVDGSALSVAQRKYLAPLDSQLEALNYRPMCTYRVTNYGANLIREYSNFADPATCTLTIVEIQTNVNGVKCVRNSHVVNFTTRFSGGKWLTTRNMEFNTVIDTPAYRIVQECPHITALAQLKKKHDASCASLATPVSPPRPAHTLFPHVHT